MNMVIILFHRPMNVSRDAYRAVVKLTRHRALDISLERQTVDATGCAIWVPCSNPICSRILGFALLQLAANDAAFHRGDKSATIDIGIVADSGGDVE